MIKQFCKKFCNINVFHSLSRNLDVVKCSYSISQRLYSLDTNKDGSSLHTENVREIPIKTDGVADGTSNFGTKFSGTTYVDQEVNKFRLIADTWWDKNGECKPLHALNKLRVALVRDGLIQSKLSNPRYVNGPEPLKGLRILDVGCGGGILCEPLARLGATVVGLDAAEENVEVGRLHAQKDPKVAANVSYIPGTVEDHAETLTEPYDAVVASEVIEHVQSPELFVNVCSSIIKPGGSFFITTLNKTTQSWLGAIVVAEYLLNILPKGTHDWNKFVPQQDLKFILERSGCSPVLIHGMAYVPFLNEWFWVPDSSVCYALHAVRTST